MGRKGQDLLLEIEKAKTGHIRFSDPRPQEDALFEKKNSLE